MIRNKLGNLADHLLNQIELLSGEKFSSLAIEEKRKILDTAKNINDSAKAIAELAKVELAHRSLDMQDELKSKTIFLTTTKNS